MKTASKTDTRLVQHAIATPGNIVVSGPRQCGMTNAIIRNAAYCGERCLILGRTLSHADELKKVWKYRFRNTGNLEFDSLGKLKVDVENENVTVSLNGHPLSQYDRIYVDLASFAKNRDDLFAVATVFKGQMVFTSTGSNTKEWHEFVRKLVSNHNFSSLFPNPVRRKDFLRHQKLMFGDEAFEREFMVNLTEGDNGK